MASDQGLSFDNQTGLTAKDAIPFIRNLFSRELPQFKVTREYRVPSGYWIITFAHDDVTISIESSRSYLEWQVFDKDMQLDLKLIDPEIVHAEASSKLNVEYMTRLTRRVLEAKQ